LFIFAFTEKSIILGSLFLNPDTLFKNKVKLEAKVQNIRIGTRGSKLALWQANFTKAALAEIGVDSELVIIKTQGDKIQHLGFDKLEGKGFFTKEIEDSLLRGDIDMAVHSMKDLPTQAPEGLAITAVSYRADPADWLVMNKKNADQSQIFHLKKNPVVGTSSARRKAQFNHFRPDAILKDIRGNVPTRLEKLKNGDFDAILLAAAGISRLEMEMDDFIIYKMNPKEFVPAPAQGVLAWQTNRTDRPTRQILKQLHHPEVSAATNIERTVLKMAEGGCHMPLGVYCRQDTNLHFHVWAAKAETWDGPVKQVRMSSSTSAGLAEKVYRALEEK